MIKSPMKYFVRAWDKELKTWPGMKARKHRKSCARDFASASAEIVADEINCQQDADDLVAEELTYWGD
jgi:hypothetical protein